MVGVVIKEEIVMKVEERIVREFGRLDITTKGEKDLETGKVVIQFVLSKGVGCYCFIIGSDEMEAVIKAYVEDMSAVREALASVRRG